MKNKAWLLLCGVALLGVACCTHVVCANEKFTLVNLVQDDPQPKPDPISTIMLPVVPVTVQPDDPVPQPQDTLPKLVSDLHAGELYVIEYSQKLKVESSRDGFVSVLEKRGPLTMFARFADGVERNEYEERTYAGEWVYICKAVKTGACELLIFSDVDSPVVRQVLTVTVGPRPPPDPDPKPDPDPEPDPTPGPVTSFRVIFVVESGDTLSAAQTGFPAAKSIREYLNAKTTKEKDLPSWREYDPDISTQNEYPGMKALWDTVKPKLLKAPCMVVEVNGTATVMPYPKDVADALAVLKKAGGD